MIDETKNKEAIVKDEKLTRVKRQIARLTSEELDSVYRYINKRMTELATRKGRANADEAWKRAKRWRAGQIIYCAASGTFLGGPLQRGDKLIVNQVQPRKKVLWAVVEHNNKVIGFPPIQIHRYNLQSEKPVNEIPLLDRRIADKLGTAIGNAFSDNGR